MDIPKTVYALIGVIVAVLIVATVAVPVVEDSQSHLETKFNNGSALNFEMSLNGEYVLEKPAGTMNVSINGETFAPGSADNYLLLNDSLYIVQTASELKIRTASGQTTIASDDVLRIEFDNGTMLVTIDGNTTTYDDITSGFVASKEGKFVSTSLYGTAYVNSVSDVSFGVNGTSGLLLFISGENVSSSAAVSVPLTPVSGYVDLYTIDSFSADESTVGLAIVPAEVLAHTTGYGASATALLGVALTMLFIVPVMMIVRMIAGRSD